MTPLLRFGPLALVLFACGGDPAGAELEELDSVEDSLLTSNMLTSNMLTSNMLTSNMLTSNALLRAALEDGGAPAGDGISNGARAAAILKYSARCMLRPDQTVRVTYRNARGEWVTATFRGRLGLAPDWSTRGLRPAERRWWGACLGVHTNALGRPVRISVRGPHPGLGSTASERAEFPLWEGSFFATYDEKADQPLIIYSCGGAGGCLQPGRECAYRSCGGIYRPVGACRPVARPEPTQACEDFVSQDSARFACEARASTGHALRCHQSLSADSGGAAWKDSAITEVLSVFGPAP